MGEFISATDELKQVNDFLNLSKTSANALKKSFKDLTGEEILNKLATSDLSDELKFQLVQKYATDAANYSNVASINAVSASQKSATTTTTVLGKSFKGL